MYPQVGAAAFQRTEANVVDIPEPAWEPSGKAIAQFPAPVQGMNRNLIWTTGWAAFIRWTLVQLPRGLRN